jgi:hypothetical protein
VPLPLCNPSIWSEVGDVSTSQFTPDALTAGLQRGHCPLAGSLSELCRRR